MSRTHKQRGDKKNIKTEGIAVPQRMCCQSLCIENTGEPLTKSLCSTDQVVRGQFEYNVGGKRLIQTIHSNTVQTEWEWAQKWNGQMALGHARRESTECILIFHPHSISIQISLCPLSMRGCPEGVLPRIGDVEEAVLVFVVFVYLGHQGRRRGQCVVHENEDCFLWLQFDPFTDDIDELTHRQIRRNEVFLLVDIRDVALLGLLADHWNTFGVLFDDSIRLFLPFIEWMLLLERWCGHGAVWGDLGLVWFAIGECGLSGWDGNCWTNQQRLRHSGWDARAGNVASELDS